VKIGELAVLTGLSTHTIRYYERIGLLPPATRDGARHRDYDVSILTWIEFLGRMKTTGMPLRDMLHYARLRAEGPSTGPERRELLSRHRAEVAARAADLAICLTVLDAKIASYGESHSETEQTHEPPKDRKPLRTRHARAQ
jgi:DNA-binding transcriptional MerR regulator